MISIAPKKETSQHFDAHQDESINDKRVATGKPMKRTSKFINGSMKALRGTMQ